MRKQLQKIFFALGTVNTITVPNPEWGPAVELAKTRVLELDDRLSVFKQESDVSRINQAAGIRFVKVHPDTFQLIKTALEVSRLSDGTFDLTARPLTALWGIGKKGDFVPSPDEIAEARTLVNYQDVLLEEGSCAVMLKRFRQSLDLGGIAKGYAADEVRHLLIEQGVTEALINLGGTVSAIGCPRTLGIQHPDKPTGMPMGRITLTGNAAVTSGSNEKFFLKDGIRYHHIMDPRTGCPANSGLFSVTLLGSPALLLDALTTAIFVSGLQAGLALIRPFELQAVFITDTLDVYATAGLQEKFTMIRS